MSAVVQQRQPAPQQQPQQPQGPPPPVVLPRPPCPLVTGRTIPVATPAGQLPPQQTPSERVLMRMDKLAYKVEVHMSTAFVTIKGTFVHARPEVKKNNPTTNVH